MRTGIGLVVVLGFLVSAEAGCSPPRAEIRNHGVTRKATGTQQGIAVLRSLRRPSVVPSSMRRDVSELYPPRRRSRSLTRIDTIM